MTKKTTTALESEVEAAPLPELNTAQVKLVCIEYERKINLETISKHRPYESASKKVSMWADIAPEERGDIKALKARLDELDKLVKDRVTTSLQETVAAVRAADVSTKFSRFAVDAAFDHILENFVPELEGEKARAAFEDVLKSTQEFQQSQ